MLQLSNVKKFYSSRLVLEIPSLSLEEGIYWVKGANGSGKTTLLKIISGILPFDGDVIFKNSSIKNQQLQYRQKVSWAEAEPLFPPFMTGMDLVSLYRKIRKASTAEIAALIKLFAMNDFINSKIGTYSAGMIKKLSLVLAFTGNPSLIMLDEPLITLDPVALKALNHYILTKHTGTGTSFLMSSHQEPAMELLNIGKTLTVDNCTVHSP